MAAIAAIAFERSEAPGWLIAITEMRSPSVVIAENVLAEMSNGAFSCSP